MALARGESEPRPLLRASLCREVEIEGRTVFLHTGEYADGRLCEVFVTVSKTGSDVQAYFSAWCIAFSVALQHGVPLEVLLDKHESIQCRPQGWVTGCPVIRSCRSVFDYVARWLRHVYVEKKDPNVIPPDYRVPDEPPAEAPPDAAALGIKMAGHPSEGSGA